MFDKSKIDSCHHMWALEDLGETYTQYKCIKCGLNRVEKINDQDEVEAYEYDALGSITIGREVFEDEKKFPFCVSKAKEYYDKAVSTLDMLGIEKENDSVESLMMIISKDDSKKAKTLKK